jgi:hypothetical protein
VFARLCAAARRRMSSRRGQTALVLILVIAVALVVYAASLNWARVTQYKTMTILGSNMAAANMASIVASYGEQQLQVNLGGRPKYCKRTNFMVMVAVIVIVIIVVILTWGAAVGLLLVVGAMIVAVVVIGMAIAALLINLLIIQPGLTALWNKMQDALLTMEDKVIENGIMTALQSTVTDAVQVQDHFDMDIDGQWVTKLGLSNINRTPDSLSRFGFYYTLRLRLLTPKKIVEVDRFFGDLNEFVYDNPYNKVGPRIIGPPASGCTAAQETAGSIRCQDPDRWGLYDPGCNGSNPSPYCNPCCVPETDSDGNRLRPEGCPAGLILATCQVPAGALAPTVYYGAFPGPYYYQYAPFYENFANNNLAPPNAFISFREKLGVDDEHPDFQKLLGTPNGPQAVDALGLFKESDVTGFYDPPEEGKVGLFPFFWRMGNLTGAVPLVVPPTVPPTTYLKTDNVNIITYNPVTSTNRFRAQEGRCALEEWENDTNTPKGFFWKPGSDHFCSTRYPYYDCSGRSGACTSGVFDGTVPACGCSASSNKSQWREDPVDGLSEGLTNFIAWATRMIPEYNGNTDVFYNNFASWYTSAAYWIAPRCQAGWNCGTAAANQAQCSYCNDQEMDGFLLVWRDQMRDWVDLLDRWLYGRSAIDAVSTSFEDDNSWCLPQDETAVPVHEHEAIINARTLPLPLARPVGGLPGVPIPPEWGDLNDTIACLNYNVDNSAKFDRCLTSCTAAPPPASVAVDCLDLPRSVVNNFFTDPSVNEAYRKAQRMQNCLNSTCTDPAGPPGNVLPVCNDATFQAFLPPATAAVLPDCTSVLWRLAANPYRAYLVQQRDANFAASAVCTRADPLVPTAFQTNVQASVTGALLQRPEFTARAATLSALRTEALAARSVFLEGYQKFNDFLKPCADGLSLGQCGGGCLNGGPAAQLICARQRAETYTSILPNFAIYGWRGAINPSVDLKRPEEKRGQGYWHIVRVEAFAPKRCYGRCGTSEFPKVKTYTKWKFNAFTGPDQFRCYELEKTDGHVIVRVTRYDEDRDSPGAYFANQQKIWNYKFRNPGAPFDGNANTNNLERTCEAQNPNVFMTEVSPETEVALQGAFMLNVNPSMVVDDPTTAVNEAETMRMYTPACWEQVDALLNTGVTTTTCARYYLDESINHMNLKFTPCDEAEVNYVTRCSLYGC